MQEIAFDDIDGMNAMASEEFGDWGDEVVVDQEMVNQFAHLTGDHQWIHIDVERCERESPFGGPIVHGFFTLSLLPQVMPRVLGLTLYRLDINFRESAIIGLVGVIVTSVLTCLPPNCWRDGARMSRSQRCGDQLHFCPNTWKSSFQGRIVWPRARRRGCCPIRCRVRRFRRRSRW